MFVGTRKEREIVGSNPSSSTNEMPVWRNTHSPASFAFTAQAKGAQLRHHLSEHVFLSLQESG